MFSFKFVLKNYNNIACMQYIVSIAMVDAIKQISGCEVFIV